ncbi:Lytic polysaccharide mono-oxygenase, cellulose-degrading, partial [Rhizoctonia solani]
MRVLTFVTSFFLLVSCVLAHGRVKTPPTRTIGSAMLAACGEGPVKAQQIDAAGPIESEIARIGSDFNPTKCNLFFCRGHQFEDNKATVQSYKPGQVVNIDLDIVNHHPSGYANVSVIDSATNKRIGQPLIAWNPYFGSGYPYPKSEENFNVTIPELNGKCKVAGECVIQYHWYSINASQTYQNCIDFTVL